MPVEEEFYYWMNVIMGIVPGMDYPLLAKLLPWCMKQVGYDEWLPVLEAAIAETRITETEPGSLPDGCSAVICKLTESMREYSENISLSFFDKDWGPGNTTWPDERLKSILYILPAGEYQMMLGVSDEDGEYSTDWVMTRDGWVWLGPDVALPENTVFTFEEGGVYELTTDGLP